MAYRRVLCLAFSRRDGGHCFAGIALDTGTWVRPVPTSAGGCLHYHQCLVQKDGHLSDPRLLDIIEVDLLTPAPKLGQPENWLMGNENWRFVGQGTKADLTRHISDDPELFRGYDKFVSALDIEARPPQCSLVLVAPQRLAWFAKLNSRGKRQFVGTFSILGQSYALPLTDEAYEKHLADIPLHERRWHDASVPILLTLSLGDVYEETKRHYKLIAGVVT